MAEGAHRSIGEVLTLLKPDFPDITISKIRFLESQGLLAPERTASGYRKFYDADIDRLRWVLVQQREQFLPLKVIKEKLDAGAWQDAGGAAADDDGPRREARSTHPLDVGPSSVAMSRDELIRASGLSAESIAELERFGLIEPDRVEGEPVYRDDALLAVRAASGFMERGLEVRHLRAYKVAAEREAGLIEQVVLPLSRQRGGEGRTDSVQVLGELIELGDDLRRATLRRALGRYLDGS